MDPRSERIIGQLVNPEEGARTDGAASSEPAGESTDPAQVVDSRATNVEAYRGPERRVQGYLIAEIFDEAPPQDPSHPSGSSH